MAQECLQGCVTERQAQWPPDRSADEQALFIRPGDRRGNTPGFTAAIGCAHTVVFPAVFAVRRSAPDTGDQIGLDFFATDLAADFLDDSCSAIVDKFDADRARQHGLIEQFENITDKIIQHLRGSDKPGFLDDHRSSINREIDIIGSHEPTQPRDLPAYAFRQETPGEFGIVGANQELVVEFRLANQDLLKPGHPPQPGCSPARKDFHAEFSQRPRNR